MHICHINSVAGRDLVAATNLVKEAQAKGIRVTVESYPYGAFSTAIGAEFMRGPDWLERLGAKEYSAMELQGKPLDMAKIEELQKASPGEAIVFHFLREDDNPEDMKLLDLAVLYPGGAIASDAIGWIPGAPSSRATSGRCLKVPSPTRVPQDATAASCRSGFANATQFR